MGPRIEDSSNPYFKVPFSERHLTTGESPDNFKIGVMVMVVDDEKLTKYYVIETDGELITIARDRDAEKGKRLNFRDLKLVEEE